MNKSRSAFTLVEMLVSIAVLVLIMTFIGQMMSSVSLSTTLSSKHIDTDTQARLVFDRMANDFAGMPQRKDIQFLFAKETGTTGDLSTDTNDKMFFYSQAPAYFDTSDSQLFPPTGADPKSNMSLIGYCINTGSNNTGNGDNGTANITPPPYCLQRLSRGLTWDYLSTTGTNPGAMSFLAFPPNGYQGYNYMSPVACTTLSGTFGAVGSAPDFAGSDSDYATLANQVFRLEFCFQVKDLSVNTNGQPAGGTVYSNYPVAAFTDSSNTTNQNNTTFAGNEAGGVPVRNDPPTAAGSRVNGLNIHVGDRWFWGNSPTGSSNNPNGGVAMMCTGVSSTGITWAPIGLSDVTAIVVAIAVMDSNSRKTLSQAQLQEASLALPDFPDPSGQTGYAPSATEYPLMATTWENAINSQTDSFSQKADNMPQSAVSQIRVYQHFFYLNNN